MGSTSSFLADAVRHHQSGQLEDAERLYRKVLDVDPDHFDALHLSGLVAHQRGRLGEAVELMTRAIGINPNSAEACYGLGNAVVKQGDLEQAIEWWQRAVQLKPTYPQACYNLATAMTQQDRTEEAVQWYQRAIELRGDYLEACFNLGNAMSRLGRLEEAVESYRRALQINPDSRVVHNNLGNTLKEQGELGAAIQHYGHALRLEPGFAEAHNNLGSVFMKQGRYAEAGNCFEQALRNGSDSAETHNNLGIALSNQGKRAVAMASFQSALELDPSHAAARSQLLLQQQHLCQWADLQAQTTAVIGAVRSGSADVSPHGFLSVAGATEAQQLQCAQTWASRRFDRIIQAGRQVEFPHSRQQRDRLTIGYLSADFREHPVAMTLAELIEKHDRSKVRALGYSFGQDDGSTIRQRLVRAFDEFLDLAGAAHLAAARKIHDDGVDILVDLMGYTRDSRLEVAALRPAPIQASYWGYCGTTGTSFIDYMLVDEFVIPDQHSAFYSEQLVRLPGCYMPYDSGQEMSSQVLCREDHGLPADADGLVFCCFNNTYKITPQVFEVWMRLLNKVENSVLWLLMDLDEAVENLRREAESQGVSSQRLVFAPRVSRPDHLARLQHADLFLDTIPYNAHTAANDALWSGCPVLTVRGETLASRVAGSALRTIGLPELVTASLDEYQQVALRLAESPQELSDLAAKLVRRRPTSSLFDGAQKAADLEQAYARMWDIYSAGESPRGFRIDRGR